MKSINEKLGITPGPWTHSTDDHCWFLTMDSDKDGVVFESEIPNQPEKEDADLIAAAPEMLMFLIYLHESAREPCSSDYEHVEKMIEKATGKTWEEIKELIK